MAAGAPTRWWGWLLAGLAYSLLTGLAFPPVGWWPLAVLAPAPLCWAGLRAGNPGVKHLRAGALVSLGALPLWVVEQRWLMDVAGLWYVLLAGYLALYAGVCVALVGGWLRRSGPERVAGPAVVCAVVWTALEVVRGEVIWGGYAWFLAAHPLIDFGRYLGAPVLGTYFASFAVVLAGASAVAWVAGQRAVKPVYAGVAGLVVVVCVTGAVGPGWGAAGAGAGGGAASLPVARIAIVQTNVPSDNKGTRTIADELRSFERTLELTRTAPQVGGTDGLDLIVWPETMFPGPALNDEAVEEQRRSGLGYTSQDRRVPMTEFRDRLVALQTELGVPMLVGAIAMDGLKIDVPPGGGRVRLAPKAKYNSAFMIRDGQVQAERYDKLELMAFGEVVPYAWRFKALQQWVGDLSGTGWVFDLDWGARETVFSVPVAARGARGGGQAGELRFVTPICFEGTMSRIVRRLCWAGSGVGPGVGGAGGVDAVINMTNDGWFGPFAGGREQHLLATRWRAVELGVPVLRGANTGVSALIQAGGGLAQQLGPHVDGVLLVEVPAGIGGTWAWWSFGRLGNSFGWGCVILAGAGVVRMLLPAGRAGR